MAVDRADLVDDAAVATRHPQLRAVDRKPTHVGRTAAGNLEGLLHRAGGQVDQPDRTLAAIGHVHDLRVATDVEAVRAFASGDEADLGEGVAVDFPHAVALHVGDVEDLAVG